MFHFLWAVISSSSFVSSLLGNFLAGRFETLVILSTMLLPIKSPVASAVCWIVLFEAVFIRSVVDLSALSRGFWSYLLLKFYLCFSQRQKPKSFYIYFSRFNWISIFYNGYFIQSLKLNLFCLLFLIVDYFDL